MPDDQHPFPTLPHHIVWSWKIPVAEWLGDAFAEHEGAVLPYLVLGDELALVDSVEEQLMRFGPSHLQRGLAIAGGEGPIPGDITEREAHRTAFRLLAEHAGDTPQSALLQLAEELGELIGAAVRERVLRNADALGAHSSASDCNLIFAIYERRVQQKPESAVASAYEITLLFRRIVLDDLAPRHRRKLRAIYGLARETVERSQSERKKDDAA
ncbi:MAG TPA: hypothetical protein VFY20_08555 [Gemmatimonadales bacterium]|nr:hypothetical protein [Gemmatimonadales bacterium]